ncbi:Hypothetical predicted protein [Lecanosticta acicola]|uniref:Apple domain-containing protein n=1 Tax=Lecanosticta acicola TaxID=111012 RepID=A0AAI8YW28_9PEZI|nr:Hypothetical predicted protein [Lecanosticta acicola]
MNALGLFSLFAGLAQAGPGSVGVGVGAGPGLAGLTACLDTVTVTLLPSDYSGSLLSIPTNIWPSLPTLSNPVALPTISLGISVPTQLPSLSPPAISVLSTIPPLQSLLPSGALDLPTITLPLSASVPTIPLPSGTPVSYACPEDDLTVIIENQLPYVLRCSATAVGNTYAQVLAADSFNDCFLHCDQSSTDGGAGYCTGFYYEGVADGEGAGTCYLQNSVLQALSDVSGSGSSTATAGSSGGTFSANRFIAAVRLLNYIAGGGSALPTLASDLAALTTLLPPAASVSNIPLTTDLPNAISSLAGGATQLPGEVSSLLAPLTTVLPNGVSAIISDLNQLSTVVPQTTRLPGAVSSLLAEVSAALPTDLSITTQIPGAVSSILAGVSAALPTNLPITSDLPIFISSLLNGVSSDLNALTGVLPQSTQLPGEVSSILAGETGALPTNLPLTTILPNGVSLVISDLTQLSTLTPSNLVPTNLIPTATPSLPNVAGGLSSEIAGLTSVIGGLPTVIPIPPLPLSIPSLSLPNLGDLTTVVGGLTTVLPNPSLSIFPSPSLPSNVVPRISSVLSAAVGELSGLTTVLNNGLTTVIPPAPAPTNAINSLLTSALGAGVSSNLGAVTSALGNLGGLSTLVSVPSIINLPSVTGGDLSPTTHGNPLTNLLPESRGSTPTSSSGIITIPTATSIPVFSCPNDNGLTYVSPAGDPFRIQCSVNFPGYTVSTALQTNLETCVNSCADVPGCTGVTYQPSSYTCSYKSAVGSGTPDQTYDGAAPVDLSCPNASGAFYIDSWGSDYKIMCNYSFPDSTNLTSTSISKRSVDLLDQGLTLEERELARRADSDQIIGCSSLCSRTPGCLAVNQDGDTCTLISSLGPTGGASNTADTVILVVKRLVFVNAFGVPVTSTSTPASVPTIVTSRPISAINNIPATTISSVPLSSVVGAASSSVLGGVGNGLSSLLNGAGSGATATGGSGSVTTASPLASVVVGVGAGASSVLAGVGGVVGGLGGNSGGAAATSSTSSSRALTTIVVPVTTLITTETVTSCSTRFLGGLVCPTVALTSTLVGSRTTVAYATPSTLSTMTRVTWTTSGTPLYTATAAATTNCGALVNNVLQACPTATTRAACVAGAVCLGGGGIGL